MKKMFSAYNRILNREHLYLNQFGEWVEISCTYGSVCCSSYVVDFNHPTPTLNKSRESLISSQI